MGDRFSCRYIQPLIAAAITLGTVLAFSSVMLAQNGAQKPPTTTAPQRAASAGTADQVDLSGNWGFGLGTNFSQKGGAMDVGTPADGVPYQPWALKTLLSERP